MINDDKLATQTILKAFLRPFAYIVIGLVFGLLLFNQCGGVDTNRYLKDSFKEKFEALEVRAIESGSVINILKYKADSLKAQKNKTRNIYIHVRDSILLIDSSCIVLSNTCDDVIKEYEGIIANKDLTITEYDTLVSVKDAQIVNCKENIKALQDSIPKAYKRGLKKGRKQGFIGGVGISALLYVGSKIKP